jgi:large subunit ribosomal protein L41
MRPTLAVLSKASRRPLTPKRGNKDFYKGDLASLLLLFALTCLALLTGTRQAHPPGIGFRTGAPGAHVIGGTAKYRLIDQQVRVFVAPPVNDIINSPVCCALSLATKIMADHFSLSAQAVRGRLPTADCNPKAETTRSHPPRGPHSQTVLRNRTPWFTPTDRSQDTSRDGSRPGQDAVNRCTDTGAGWR